MPELIFEIGSEEIPAGMIGPALDFMADEIRKKLGDAHLECGEITTFGTPRRLGFVLDGLAAAQADREETATGPKVQFAYDSEGLPTKAAQGFARGQGVPVEDLIRVETPKGECVAAQKTVKGKPTGEILAEILPQMVRRIPFRKSMRWSDRAESFVRPVHWIVALFDKQVVPFEFAGIASGHQSRGHRFMCPESFDVGSAKEFLATLPEVRVLPDPEERVRQVTETTKELAKKAGGKPVVEEALLREIANLVEYPFGQVGYFDEAFTEVPKEILIDSMTSHQRYIPIVREDGKLLPCFVMFNNTEVADPEVSVAGNQRVLRARLADARYFYETDSKKKLEDFSGGLAKVTFQEKLGSIGDKIARMRGLLEFLAPLCAPETLENASRANELCKADLNTLVVNEFPDLQGIMGRIYATKDGEAGEVCQAIEEHYRPRFAQDEIPETTVGALVAMADKMDTICGCFGVGLIPSGTADPYALRRAALGVLRILSGKGWKIDLPEFIHVSVEKVGEKLTRPADDVETDVKAFFEMRFRNMVSAQYPQDIVDGVCSARFVSPVNVLQRIQALADFRGREGFEDLAMAFKRVMNILKEDPGVEVDPGLFDQEAETLLHDAAKGIADRIEGWVNEGKFLDVLEALATLKAPVDRFFDDVLVMDKDEAKKNNRLALLGFVAKMLNTIADFRKLGTE